jgi:hypothetical protein
MSMDAPPPPPPPPPPPRETPVEDPVDRPIVEDITSPVAEEPTPSPASESAGSGPAGAATGEEGAVELTVPPAPDVPGKETRVLDPVDQPIVEDITPPVADEPTQPPASESAGSGPVGAATGEEGAVVDEPAPPSDETDASVVDEQVATAAVETAHTAVADPVDEPAPPPDETDASVVDEQAAQPSSETLVEVPADEVVVDDQIARTIEVAQEQAALNVDNEVDGPSDESMDRANVTALGDLQGKERREGEPEPDTPDRPIDMAANLADIATSSSLGDVLLEGANLTGPAVQTAAGVFQGREVVADDLANAFGESIRAVADNPLDPVTEMEARGDASPEAVEWQSYEVLRVGVEQANVATDPDTAIFYAGHDPVFAEQGDVVRDRQIAESYAMQTDRQTLEMTAGGAWLEQQVGTPENPNPNLSEAQRAELWDRLSERYVQGASGEVVVFDRLPNPISPNGNTWRRVEEPALKVNPNIENIQFL